MVKEWTAGLILTATPALLEGCEAKHQYVQEGSVHHILQPLPEDPAPAKVHRLTYIPVYSGIYWGMNDPISDLTAALTVRNVSLEHPMVLHSVRYNDSEGRLVREHLDRPGLLGPLAKTGSKLDSGR